MKRIYNLRTVLPHILIGLLLIFVAYMGSAQIPESIVTSANDIGKSYTAGTRIITGLPKYFPDTVKNETLFAMDKNNNRLFTWNPKSSRWEVDKIRGNSSSTPRMEVLNSLVFDYTNTILQDSNNFKYYRWDLTANIWNTGLNGSDTLTNYKVFTPTIANVLGYKEIYSGATLPASATIYQTGNKFLLTTDSTEYTYQGNHVWFSNIVKGTATPSQKVVSGSETFDNSRAVWKNPNINIFGKTVDYTFQNTTWQPQKKFIDVADYGAIAGSGVSTLTRSNNTQAIQAAFNVISATGGQLIISDIYDIDSLELQNSNNSNFSAINITGKSIAGSGLNVYGLGVGIGMEGRNFLRWSNMTINFLAGPQVGFLLCRTSYSQNCNNNWFTNMIISGSAKIASVVTLASESMRFTNVRITNQDTTGGACYATSNGLAFGIADTSTIITSSNTDIIFSSTEMYHANSNAKVLRLSTAADIKFIGCSFIIGDQSNSSIAEFSTLGNIFDGVVLFDGCLFEASRSPFTFINTAAPVYWKNINVKNCYINNYATNGSGGFPNVVNEINTVNTNFGYFFNFNWEHNRFSNLNPKLKLGFIFDSRIYHHTEGGTFECTLAYNCNIDVISITNTPSFGQNSIVRTATSTSFDKLNLDVSKTTGNPIIAKGLLQGLATDSIVTDSAGIFRRQSVIGLTNTYNNVPYSSVAFGDGVPLTTTNGFNMVLIGSYAGASLVANQTANNTLIGTRAGTSLTNTGTNTFIGSTAGYYNTGTSSIMLGAYSGKFTTVSNKLIFNSIDRTNALADSTYSIINGTMDSSVVNQKLRFNAATITMPYLSQGANTDSILSSASGVVKRLSAAQVVQNGITKTSVTSTFTVPSLGEYLIPFTLTGTTNTSIVAASYIATDVTGCSFSIPYLAGDGTGTVKVINRTASAVTFTGLKVNFAVLSY